MPNTLKTVSIETAIILAPGLRRGAARHGNSLRREHIAAAAACGEVICQASGMPSFQEYVHAALGADLISHPGSAEALEDLARPVMAVLEGERATRIMEMALAFYGIMVTHQRDAKLPRADLAEITAAVFALFALASETHDEEDMGLALDSLDLLSEGVEIGRKIAADMR